MFSLTSMSNALHNSQLDFAALDVERRIAKRENFFIGGMIPRVEQGLNYAWRPFKLAGAFLVNVDKKEPPATLPKLSWCASPPRSASWYLAALKFYSVGSL